MAANASNALTTTAVTHAKKTHLPGEAGLWVLIGGDLLTFGLFFCTFMFYRGQDVDLYRASQLALNRDLGALNTTLLLTSSWLVVNAVAAFRERSTAFASRLFSAAIICGLGFVISKLFEYGEKVRAGILPTTNEFYMFYYAFTGIHLLHVLIGLLVLIFLLARSRRAWTEPSQVRLIEGGAVFWHLVDLLWVVLFALLYLMR